MLITERDVFSKSTLSIFLLILSGAFQIGYFNKLALEYISLSNGIGLLITFAFLSATLMLSHFVAVKIFHSIKKYAHEDDGLFGFISLQNYPRIHNLLMQNFLNFLIYFSLLLSPFIALFYVGLRSLAVDLFFLLFLAILALWTTAQLFARLELYKEIHYSWARECAFCFVLLSYNLGGFYSSYIAGANCEVLTKASKITGTFYRSLEGGLLIGIGKKLTFVPNGEILQIVCNKSPSKIRSNKEMENTSKLLFEYFE